MQHTRIESPTPDTLKLPWTTIPQWTKWGYAVLNADDELVAHFEDLNEARVAAAAVNRTLLPQPDRRAAWEARA